MKNASWMFKFVVCLLGMLISGMITLFVLLNAFYDWGMNWWYLFAFVCLFYLCSVEFDKLF